MKTLMVPDNGQLESQEVTGTVFDPFSFVPKHSLEGTFYNNQHKLVLAFVQIIPSKMRMSHSLLVL